MTVRKKDRFEVFKRDSFTCQYCGKAAPDVILQVDHIQPVSKDGSDNILNLVTSCWECNIGKGARELSDDTVVKKQQAQLEQLQERREQIEMMLEWQQSLMNLEQEQIEMLATIWADLTPGRMLNKSGQRSLRKLLNEYKFPEIVEAMKVASSQYLEFDEEGNTTSESAQLSLKKLRGICYVHKQQLIEPYIKDLFYIRGILRKRFYHCVDYLAIKWLRQAAERGCPIDQLKDMSKNASDWAEWKYWMSEYVEVD